MAENADRVVKQFRLPSGQVVKARVDPTWDNDTIKTKLIDKGVVPADTWKKPEKKAVDEFFAPEAEVGPDNTLADIDRATTGVMQAGAQMTTGIASAALGATSGLRAAMHAAYYGGDAGQAYVDTFENQSAWGTYEPRSPEGKMASQMMAAPFVLAGEGGEKLGEKVYQATVRRWPSAAPVLATIARIIPEGIAYASPFLIKMRPDASRAQVVNEVAREATKQDTTPVTPTRHQAEPMEGSPLEVVQDAPAPVTPIKFEHFQKADSPYSVRVTVRSGEKGEYVQGDYPSHTAALDAARMQERLGNTGVTVDVVRTTTGEKPAAGRPSSTAPKQAPAGHRPGTDKPPKGSLEERRIAAWKSGASAQQLARMRDNPKFDPYAATDAVRDRFEWYENYINEVNAKQYDAKVREPVRQKLDEQGVVYKGDRKAPTDENYRSGELVQPYLTAEEYMGWRRKNDKTVQREQLAEDYEVYRSEALSGGAMYPKGYWENSPLRHLEDGRIRETLAIGRRVVEDKRAWVERGVTSPEDISAIKRKKMGIWHSYVGPVLGAESLEVFRKYERHSPTLRKVLDDIVTPSRSVVRRRKLKDVRGVEVAQESIEISRATRIARLMGTVEKLVQKSAPKVLPVVRGKKTLSPALTKSAWKQLTDRKLPFKDLTPTNKVLRSVLDEVYSMMKDAGVSVERHLLGYMPIYLRTDYLRKHRDAFETMLMEDVGLPAEAARRITETYIDREGSINAYDSLFISKTPGAQGKPSAKKTRSEFERRLFDKIPIEKLEPFMERDVVTSIQRYVQDGVERAIFSEKYGPQGEKFRQQADLVRQELEAAGVRLDRAHWERLRDVVNASFRRHQRPETQVGRAVTRAGQAAITLGQVAWLTWSGLLSLSEGALAVRRGGVPRTMRAVVGATKDSLLNGTRLLYKDIPKSEAVKLVDAMGKTLSMMAQERMTSLGMGDANAISNAFFHVNGQHMMTHWLFNMSNRIFRDELRTFALEDAKRARGEMGLAARLTKDAAHKLRGEELSRIVPLDKLKRWGARGAKWEDLPADHALVVGALRFSEDIVLHREAGRGALWQASSNVLARQANFLSGYPTAIGNKVGKELIRDFIDSSAELVKADDKMGSILNSAARMWGAGELVVGLATVATGIVLLRRMIRDGDINPDELDEDELTYDVMEEMLRVAGLGGRPQMVLESLGAAQRYGGNPLVANAGPAASMLTKLAKGLSQDVEVEQVVPYPKAEVKGTGGTVKAMSSLIPFLNLNRKNRDQTVEGTTRVLNEVLDVQKKRGGRTRRTRRSSERSTR